MGVLAAGLELLTSTTSWETVIWRKEGGMGVEFRQDTEER